MRPTIPAPSLSRRRALSLSLGLAVLVASCASTESKTGDRLRVTLYDHMGGTSFELVSESHSDRIEYYSTVRSGASRKYQGDRTMAALIEALDDEGFAQYGKGGRAPSATGGVITRSLEIQRNARIDHWAVGEGSAPESKISFHACTNTFLQLYNVTQAYQAIDNESGTGVFEKEGRT